MGMAENTRERGREQAGMSREGRRTMEKVLENTVRDTHLHKKKQGRYKFATPGSGCANITSTTYMSLQHE